MIRVYSVGRCRAGHVVFILCIPPSLFFALFLFFARACHLPLAASSAQMSLSAQKDTPG